MPLRIANASDDRIAVDMTGVTPASLAARSLDEIRRTAVLHGNRPTPLGELFTISGDSGDMIWGLEGDTSAVHSLGADMAEGGIYVDGPVGRHAGARMRGGIIGITGDAGDFLGAEMHGGSIRVDGDAGDRVGAAYPGSRRGMTGGVILIDGDAGHGVGGRMRRGLIAVAGSIGCDVGDHMLAGTILVFGDAGSRIGAAMRRGTIGLLGPTPPALLPTYRLACRAPLPMLGLIEHDLRRAAFALARLPQLRKAVDLYHGDLLELGRGEILLPAP